MSETSILVHHTARYKFDKFRYFIDI